MNPAMRQARRKRLLVASVFIFVVIPLTVYAGVRFFDSQNYWMVSLLIIAYTMVPFFLVFERRKPRARELVFIAVMAALAAMGNVVSFAVAPIQAGTALVIIAGIALGPEAGFLVGVLAKFVANLFLGQGPWTPWQMICWGLLGFLAGFVFSKVELNQKKPRRFRVVAGPVACMAAAVGIAYLTHLLWGEGTFFGWRLYIFGAVGLLAGLLVQRKRMPVDDLTLSLFGFCTTFILYGGIMNICTMVLTGSFDRTNTDLSWGSLTVLYLSGVPYDFIHALSTAFFLFLFGEKMVRKVERVKIKYGMYR